MPTKITGPSGWINIFMRNPPETFTIAPPSTVQRSASTIHPTGEVSNLTNTAAVQLKKTEPPLADVSVVNNQKIKQIKQAILEGSYQIDSKRIADKLIAAELALSK